MRISRPAGILLRDTGAVLGLQTGADPTVLTGSFDVQAYATSRGFGTIPAETGPTQEPIADQGAVGNGTADDTAEVQAAMNALPPTGGVLDLSQGIFGINAVNDVLSIGDKSNITIKGGGWSNGVAQNIGLKVLSATTADRNDSVIRYQPGGNNLNLVIRDLEIDVGNNDIGGIAIQNDENTWIINTYVHNVGTGTQGPNAAIRGNNGHDKLRVIGCLVHDTTAAATSAVRGIWMAEDGSTDSVIGHCIVFDTGHTGIPYHLPQTTPGSFVEFCTTVRCGTAVGAAGIKGELSNQVNPATFDFGDGSSPAAMTFLGTFRRNYMTTQKSITGQFDSAMQVDTMNCLIEENMMVDAQDGISTFNRFRKIVIRNNVFQLIDQEGLNLDADNSGDDKTGVFIQNNDISRDGRSMQYGIFYFDWNGAIFDFNDPIQQTDNKIVDATTSPVLVTNDVLNYVNFSQSNNGPGGSGAQNVLLPPSYIGSL